MKIDLKDKKIGIWGFGIVGKSAYSFLKQYTNKIQILDKIDHESVETIIQTKNTIQSFFNDNDYILISPGIPIHEYETYASKFITELDLFSQYAKYKTIGITGTLGKTSVTTLLQKNNPRSIAAGNIGYPLLNLITTKIKAEPVILELSSFQLQYIKQFAPDIAIWTNFYPNHLDHHKTEQEYFQAKCNLLKYQDCSQIALLPSSLIPKIKKQITVHAKIYAIQNNTDIDQAEYPSFSTKNNNFIVTDQDKETIILSNVSTLPTYTYQENWLTIAATLYLQGINPNNLLKTNNMLTAQEHRLEKVCTLNHTDIYNDSKSTVWQATQAALDQLKNKTCFLILGGLSKGADRTPLIKYIQNKSITIYAFGKEKSLIYEACLLHKVPCYTAETLEEVIKNIMLSKKSPQTILFSPAGSSFDLYKNYQERGNIFKKLVLEYVKK